jgi:hypothetical protein
MTKAQKAEQAEAIETLREILPPGSTVFVYCSHVSRSGMSRVLVPFVFVDNGKDRPYVRHIGDAAAKALGWAHDKDQGVKVSGCGMDMGFYLVYSLAQTLYRDGYGCTGQTCQDSDHSGADAMPHKSGWYALRCEWV